jgi:pimeloyl-ACP methyl ester carboxylesterase
VELASLDGITLEYEVVGQGEPVLFIHGSFVADTFRPLLAEQTLRTGYQFINYHRRGYVGSRRPAGAVSIRDWAADCRELLVHLRVARAHVVGHSFGGVVALQLALDASEMLRTVALLEPALAVGASGPGYRESLVNAIARYRDAGAGVAVREFFRVRWPEYEEHLEAILPGAFEQAVTDAATAYEIEFPALLDWSFDEATARRIERPVLSVLGARSDALWPRFGETHRTLCSWLPGAEPYILPRATHFLQVENPHDMAEALATFWAKHPS